MNREKIIFNLPGESMTSWIIGVIGILIVIYFSITSILTLSILGVITGITLLLILFLFAYFNFILKVLFYDNYIVVKYLFRTIRIPMVSATKVYKNKEGAIPTHVYVLKYNDEKKEKKITFYCAEKEFKKSIEPWLISKEIRITKKWK